MFSVEEQIRYSRHWALPDFDEKSQLLLKQSKVLVVGCGGLGCPVIQYLAAAGVGQIGLVDDDVVSLSNLQRQILYTENDLGLPKATVAAAKVKALNPSVKTCVHLVRLDSSNTRQLFRDYDLVIDGTDNIPTRYLCNDAAVLENKTLVYGAIYQYEGQVAVFNLPLSKESFTANYRDLFPHPPPAELVPSCAEGGVLGVLPGIIGTLMACETIKILLKKESVLKDRLIIFHADDLTFRKIKYHPRSDNPITGENPTIQELIDYDAFCSIPRTGAEEINPHQWEIWRESNENFQLIDVRSPIEHKEYNIGGENIPLDRILSRLDEFNEAIPIILYCQTGKRSYQAIQLLKEKGWKGELYSLQGGAEAIKKRAIHAPKSPLSSKHSS